MPNFSGMATTYDLPNYGGELFLVTPTDTPLLTAMGGLNQRGADLVINSTEWTWQTEDLGSPAQPAILEGANAAFAERTRANFSNVVQIFQYGVSVSYTKLAANGQLAAVSPDTNPVTNELDHQIQLKLKQAARDINYTFINGTYNKPADNTAARKTRGLLAAITTQVVTNGTPAALTKTMIDTLLDGVFQSRGIHGELEPTILVNSTQKRALNKLYITDANYQEQTRDVGGVSLQQIETDFGRISIMMDRAVPSNTLVFTHLAMLKPKFLLIPGKGFLFVEELSKSGSAESYQLYGEIGLEYGDEAMHGKITNLS